MTISIHPILFLESPVVQICDFDQLLLVSNYTKCILCNTETEEFKQIGNQPRDGKFGACFLATPTKDLLQTRIFCARPGTRIWECNLDGAVLQTYKFKMALRSCRLVSLFRNSETQRTADAQTIDQLFNLQPIYGRFILGHTEDAFFIFDVRQSSVLLWNDEIGPIQNIRVVDGNTQNSIVIFGKNGRVIEFQLKRLDHLLIELMETRERYLDAAHLLLDRCDYFQQKLCQSKFLPHFMTLLGRLDASDENRTVVDKLHHRFDEIVKSNALNVDVRKIRVENGIYVIENNVMRSTIHCENFDYNDCSNDEQNEDELIVEPKKTQTQKRVEKIEAIAFTEDDRTLQNLFFVYKSLKMSNLNLVERYSDILDRYDMPGIASLLGRLAHMIVENERGVDDVEAKQYCARMFLNYFKQELIYELDEESLDFVVESFIVANRNERNERNSLQRCAFCEFPLLIDITTLRYKTIGEILIRYLWSRNARDRCTQIVDAVPAATVITFKLLLNEKLGTSVTSPVERFDEIDKNIVVSTIFACGDTMQLKQCAEKFSWFRCDEFWDKLIERFVQMNDDQTIECTKCQRQNDIKLTQSGAKRAFYSHDFLLNTSAEYLTGMRALNLCRKYSQNIPCDAITKSFYLKCLLKS